MDPPVKLPHAYDLVTLQEVDSVLHEAVRRARAGAEEGTIICADRQTNARTRSGAIWDSPAGNLHCAVVLRPEFSNEAAFQLGYVAAVSAGTAMASLLAPMTGLRYRWPGRLMINDLPAGRIEVGAGESCSDPFDWLVIGLYVNVAHHPPNPEPERYISIHDSGAPEASVGDLLVGYSRHLLTWINRWADEGFGPVRKAWVQRADGVGETLHLRVGDDEMTGKFVDVDEAGYLVLEQAPGARRRLSIGHYFDLVQLGPHEPGASRPEHSMSPLNEARAAPAGVYAVDADAKLSLVHEYLSQDYDLGDVPELLQIGRTETGPANITRVLAFDRRTLRELKVAVDARSFDLEEGFVDMCRDIQEYADSCRDPVIRFTSRSDEPAS